MPPCAILSDGLRQCLKIHLETAIDRHKVEGAASQAKQFDGLLTRV
jgi:hypothetical protein